MKDIQNLQDDRRISIRKVGVKTISYPITVLDRQKKLQHTVATVDMYVNLPHRFKGTHMSRFVEILNRFHGKFDLQKFHLILQEMKDQLDAEAAHLEVRFPYFLERTAQGGGVERYECRMHGSLQEGDDLVMELNVPITLPDSLGRWGYAQVSVRFNEFIWLEDLISKVQQAIRVGSSAASVESLCGQLGETLQTTAEISWFRVEVENLADGCSTFATVESTLS
ncbi:MAG: GTP cyclohydrolase, FolE2/MptA family [Candidatus Electrothrix sp. GW3-4]|uniref:GTP cyclohydrolase, FolE2/MptA family n=1 Tax=Candidatus Electrothrix sp. GW3-4 TaxID=3126740 RepID=UPI0030CF893C